MLLLLIVRPSIRGWTWRTWIDAIGLGIALGGMNTLIYLAFERIPIGVESSAGALSALGVLYALAAALFWAGCILASADVGRRLHGIDGLSIAMLVAPVVVIPFGAPRTWCLEERMVARRRPV